MPVDASATPDDDTAERWLLYLHVALTIGATVVGFAAIRFLGESPEEWVGVLLASAILAAWTTVAVRVLRSRYDWQFPQALVAGLGALLFVLGFVVLGTVRGEPGAIVLLFAFGVLAMIYSYRHRHG